MTNELKLKPMPIWQSIALFGGFAVIFYIATRIGIPWLMQMTGLESILCWFITGALVVFIPLFITAILLFKNDTTAFTFQAFKVRFRLNPLNAKDWLWIIGSVLGIGASTGLIMIGAEWLSAVTPFIKPINTSPPFLDYHGIDNGRYWILAAWLPMFFFNIFGEELLWRGYILPRQEAAHGQYAWLLNAALWGVFHICFGLGMIITLVPTLLWIPWIVQKKQNTWYGILIHGLFNGPAFIAISLLGH